MNELLGDLHEVRDYEDPFTALIGYNASLKNAILSAKAGILYPGGALHTMLLGESGVGKSLFAEKIFTFGKKEGIFTADSQFVVFNCADYANNAELLLSQLFGSVKGAYTGADATKEGLLKAVNILLKEKNTLFESLVNKLADYPELRKVIYALLFNGKMIPYNPLNPAIEMAEMFGFIKRENDTAVISNRIFETVLYNYFLSEEFLNSKMYDAALQDKNQFVKNGQL